MSKSSRNSTKKQSYPYDGFYKTVPAVMQRDNYACQWCGKTVGDFITRHASAIGDYQYKLSEIDFMVHHLDGNKLNNNMENLITLCRSCHQSHHSKKETREKLQTDKWRRNYYAKRKKK